MKKTEKLIFNSEKDTVKLATQIAKKVKKGNIITLRGTLGAGKTFFVNAFINALYKMEGKKPITVTSPTFNILKIYKTKKFPTYHFDLYRLKNTEELYELGIEEALENGISLIEWPKIADHIITPNFLDVQINHHSQKPKREVLLKYYRKVPKKS